MIYICEDCNTGFEFNGHPDWVMVESKGPYCCDCMDGVYAMLDEERGGGELQKWFGVDFGTFRRFILGGGK